MRDRSSLCQYLDGLVEELRRHVPLALNDFDTKAIHKSRVATRRLKAALDLLGPVLPDEQRKPFAKAGRKLRRRLGPLRDLDVMLGHLKKLRSTRHADAIQWVREKLIDTRDKARNKWQSRSDASTVLGKLGTWWGIREQLEQAEQVVPSLLADSLHRQLDDFSDHADHVSGRSTAGTESDATQRDPHQLRISGKALRYTLELADAQGHPLDRSVLKTFKKMQDALGLWHDYVVLSDRILKLSLDAELALHNPSMQSKVLNLSRYCLSRSEQSMKKFIQLWSSSGDSIAQIIHDLFPRAAHSIIESKTDHDPAGSDAPPVPPDAAEGSAPAA